MFENARTFNSYAAPNAQQLKPFYAETLGLQVSEEGDLLRLNLAGGAETIIYPKPDYTPATFTVLNFIVEDIEKAVDALSARGVRFERYEGLDADERGIHRGEGPLIAWFTDPAGNILSIVQEA